jgi:hypothetical protein
MPDGLVGAQRKQCLTLRPLLYHATPLLKRVWLLLYATMLSDDTMQHEKLNG